MGRPRRHSGEALRVESLAVNPATRSLVKRYMNGIYQRSITTRLLQAEKEARDALEGQTDRQTAGIILPPRV